MSLRGKLDRGGVKGKLALSGVMILLAASLIGGTYATWMSTVSQAQTITSGTVKITLGATGAATNRLSVATGAIAPGDTIQRSVDLTNSGSLALAQVTLTTTATTSSVLDTDTTNGLQMTIDSCSVPWTETGSAPNFTYTCSGSTTASVPSQPLIESNRSLGPLNALTAGGTDHLRVSLTFPVTADDTFQAKTSVISYEFTGTQQT